MFTSGPVSADRRHTGYRVRIRRRLIRQWLIERSVVELAGFGSPSPSQLPATPPDVPSGAPPCTGSFGQQVNNLPADLQNLISACYSSQEDEWQFTNLTQLVLDITSAAGSSSSLQVSPYDTS